MRIPSKQLLASGGARQEHTAMARSGWIGLSLAYLTLGGIAWALEPNAGDDDWWLHGLWCLAGLVLALPTLSVIFRRSFASILVDHRIIFLASFSLYFLFGAALLAFGAETEVEAVLRYYPIGAQEALRVNAINSIGFGLALLSATLSRGDWLRARAAQVARAVEKIPESAVIALFLLLGALASIYVLRFDLGGHEGYISGMLRSASRFSLVAIFLAAAGSGRREWWLRAVATALAILLAIAGALQFSKSDSLLPIAALVGGLAARFGARNVLPVGLLFLVSSYIVLGDLASYGRSAIGYRGVADVAGRWQILQDSWQGTRGLVEVEQYSTWGRLCYVPPQAAALDYRDAGDGGDGLRLLPWVFIPRFLDADKPEITKTGREFNVKITGQDTSSTGQGIFASGYYHGGWLGFVLTSVLCGWILAQTSSIASAIAARGAMLLLPFSLLGMLIAFRIDGDFVADYVGTFVFILYPILVFSLLLSATRAGRGQTDRNIRHGS